MIAGAAESETEAREVECNGICTIKRREFIMILSLGTGSARTEVGARKNECHCTGAEKQRDCIMVVLVGGGQQWLRGEREGVEGTARTQSSNESGGKCLVQGSGAASTEKRAGKN